MADVFSWFVVNSVMDLVDVGEASLSGQMQEAFQSDPIRAGLHYGPPVVGLIATLMGIKGASSAADDVVRAVDDEAGTLLDELIADPCSFSVNTLVMTQDGLKPISKVGLWEKVLAYDEEMGEMMYQPVIATAKHIDPVIVTLIIDGETIKTTLEHPFRTMGDDWVAAGNLQIGDALRNAGGDAGTVTAIHFAIAPQPMYNLIVAIAHTYFVGEKQWLVHNECPQI